MPVDSTAEGDWRIMIPAELTPKFPLEAALDIAYENGYDSYDYFQLL